MNRLRVDLCEVVAFIVRIHGYVPDQQRSEDEFPSRFRTRETGIRSAACRSRRECRESDDYNKEVKCDIGRK